MKFSRQLSAILAACSIVAASTVVPGLTAIDRVTINSTPPLTQIQKEQVAQAEIALKSVTYPFGQAIFDNLSAVQSGVTEENAVEFATGIKTGGGTVTGSPQTLHNGARFSGAVTIQLAASAYCNGAQGVTNYWWGKQLKMNSCTSQKLLVLIAAGSSILAIAGAITAAIPQARLVSIALAVGMFPYATLYALAVANNRGTWANVGGFTTVGSQ